jgi:hypothetical protein
MFTETVNGCTTQPAEQESKRALKQFFFAEVFTIFYFQFTAKGYTNNKVLPVSMGADNDNPFF